jgi:hypothetical protein
LESDFFRRVFREAQRLDPWCGEIIKVIEARVDPNDCEKEIPLEVKWRKVFALNKDGILIRKQAWLKNRETKELFVVPNSYRDEILRMYHNALHGGHLGGNKMYSRL